MFKSIAVIFLASLLIACAGYQLRQDSALVNVAVVADKNNPMGQQLIAQSNDSDNAPYSVHLADEKKTQRIVTYDNNGRADSVNLVLSIAIEVYDVESDERVLSKTFRATQFADLTDDAQIDGVKKEQVYESLRTQIITRLMLQLSNLK